MDETINSHKPSDPPANLKPIRVLIADDSENDVVIILHALRKAGYDPLYQQVSAGPAMQAALQKQSWDIVISDYEMPGFGGFEALGILKASGHDIPFILVSAVVSEETAVAAMKAGAQDYLMKRKLARLVPAIERELREAQTRAARKAAEKALKESEEQLRQAQKLEAVARLAAGVAHDFNNILTAICGNSEMLLGQLQNGDPKRKNAEQIAKCASMAAGLTRQLLTFSRKQAVESRVIKLNEVAGNLERMLRRLIGEDIDFRTLLDDKAGHIKADPGQIEQVVMNLAVNARDAMPEGGKLTVRTGNLSVGENAPSHVRGLKPGAYAVLSISDTGTGMTEEVRAHLFEPFFTTKPAGKGTGLGLATCFGIVKQSGGHIEVESYLGKGTTFRVYFPQVQEQVEPVRAGAPSTELAGGNETVLLVEDEPMVREWAGIALRERGYTVMEASNGAEALRLAQQHKGRIDLAFTDVVMPIMGGSEMASALRAVHPETKVIFTSGYSEEVVGEHGVEWRNINFLQKPYHGGSLASQVRMVLDSTPANSKRAS